MLFSRTWNQISQYALSANTLGWSTAQIPSQPNIHDCNQAELAFSTDWHSIGPFPIGTREVQWGADPLELFGGFHAFQYDKSATWRSSLAANATASWSAHTAEVTCGSDRAAEATLSVSYPDIDWQALRNVYGWAALQWQGWIRGHINVRTNETFRATISLPGIVEFWIDDVHYFGGDMYSYEKSLITLQLSPGVHLIEVRLVRDIRSMGGIGDPSVDFTLKLEELKSILSVVPVSGHDVLVSDLVQVDEDAFLASPLASVTLRNDGDYDLEVYDFIASNKNLLVWPVSDGLIRISPGQTRPLSLLLVTEDGNDYSFFQRGSVKLTLFGRYVDANDSFTAEVTIQPPLRKLHEPQKVTFLHPGQIVSYAILRPPSRKVSRSVAANGALPMLLALHGAGLEVEDGLVRHALDPLPDLAAWVLYPTGGTPWSGDDWHVWGFADVEAAIVMIPDWIRRSGWKGSGVDVNRWLVAGHSNGGQGTWYALTHRPDKIIAAAALSGYSSIQNYVPYHFWHTADPAREVLLQSALLDWRHELLLSNTAGIPILQQHGSEDDNVPPYHSRMLHAKLLEAGSNSTYHEFAGQGHWWDGIMTTKPLRKFYEEQIVGDADRQKCAIQKFTLSVVNPGSTGPKYGIEILQLNTPGQIGKLEVSSNLLTGDCSIKATNVGTFFITPDFRSCRFVRVDNAPMSLYEPELPFLAQQQSDLSWTLHATTSPEYNLHNTSLPDRPLIRLGYQHSTLHALLHTQSTILIHATHPSLTNVSLSISRNLHTYFSADTALHSPSNPPPPSLAHKGNIITLLLPSTSTPQDPLFPPIPSDFPITHPTPTSLTLRLSPSSTRTFFADPEHGLAAIYLRPIPGAGERVEIVVWGTDVSLVALAARLIPMLTGTGQPDFVVLDGRMRWLGVEAVRAMGFWDWRWRCSRNVFVETG